MDTEATPENEPQPPQRSKAKRWLRRLGWPFRRWRFCWWILALFLLPNLVGQVLTPPPAAIEFAKISKETLTLYVVVHEHHSSLLIQQPDGWALGPPGEEEAPWLEYAWGDRVWYALNDASPLNAVNTVLLPSSSVMYLDGWDDPSDLPASAELFQTTLARAESVKLFDALEGEFERGESHARLPIVPHSRSLDGVFYPSREFYLIWFNCNAWTIQMLERTDFDTSSLMVLTSSQVPARLPMERFEEVER